MVIAAQDKAATDSENNPIAIQKIEKGFRTQDFGQKNSQRAQNPKTSQAPKCYWHHNKIMLFKSRKEYEDIIYVIQEIMETDLASIFQVSSGLN